MTLIDGCVLISATDDRLKVKRTPVLPLNGEESSVLSAFSYSAHPLANSVMDDCVEDASELNQKIDATPACSTANKLADERLSQSNDLKSGLENKGHDPSKKVSDDESSTLKLHERNSDLNLHNKKLTGGCEYVNNVCNTVKQLKEKISIASNLEQNCISNDLENSLNCITDKTQSIDVSCTKTDKSSPVNNVVLGKSLEKPIPQMEPAPSIRNEAESELSSSKEILVSNSNAETKNGLISSKEVETSVCVVSETKAESDLSTVAIKNAEHLVTELKKLVTKENAEGAKSICDKSSLSNESISEAEKVVDSNLENDSSFEFSINSSSDDMTLQIEEDELLDMEFKSKVICDSKTELVGSKELSSSELVGSKDLSSSELVGSKELSSSELIGSKELSISDCNKVETDQVANNTLLTSPSVEVLNSQTISDKSDKVRPKQILDTESDSKTVVSVECPINTHDFSKSETEDLPSASEIVTESLKIDNNQKKPDSAPECREKSLSSTNISTETKTQDPATRPKNVELSKSFDRELETDTINTKIISSSNVSAQSNVESIMKLAESNKPEEITLLSNKIVSKSVLSSEILSNANNTTPIKTQVESIDIKGNNLETDPSLINGNFDEDTSLSKSTSDKKMDTEEHQNNSEFQDSTLLSIRGEHDETLTLSKTNSYDTSFEPMEIETNSSIAKDSCQSNSKQSDIEANLGSHQTSDQDSNQINKKEVVSSVKSVLDKTDSGDPDVSTRKVVDSEDNNLDDCNQQNEIIDCESGSSPQECSLSKDDLEKDHDECREDPTSVVENVCPKDETEPSQLESNAKKVESKLESAESLVQIHGNSRDVDLSPIKQEEVDRTENGEEGLEGKIDCKLNALIEEIDDQESQALDENHKTDEKVDTSQGAEEISLKQENETVVNQKENQGIKEEFDSIQTSEMERISETISNQTEALTKNLAKSHEISGQVTAVLEENISCENRPAAEESSDTCSMTSSVKNNCEKSQRIKDESSKSSNISNSEVSIKNCEQNEMSLEASKSGNIAKLNSGKEETLSDDQSSNNSKFDTSKETTLSNDQSSKGDSFDALKKTLSNNQSSNDAKFDALKETSNNHNSVGTNEGDTITASKKKEIKDPATESSNIVDALVEKINKISNGDISEKQSNKTVPNSSDVESSKVEGVSKPGKLALVETDEEDKVKSSAAEDSRKLTSDEDSTTKEPSGKMSEDSAMISLVDESSDSDSSDKMDHDQVDGTKSKDPSESIPSYLHNDHLYFASPKTNTSDKHIEEYACLKRPASDALSEKDDEALSKRARADEDSYSLSKRRISDSSDNSFSVSIKSRFKKMKMQDRFKDTVDSSDESVMTGSDLENESNTDTVKPTDENEDSLLSYDHVSSESSKAEDVDDDVEKFSRLQISLKDFSRKDLEEIIMLKMLEALKYKGIAGEQQKQLVNLQEQCVAQKKLLTTIKKQYDESNLIMKKFIEQSESQQKKNIILPMKATRSVGLQVALADTPHHSKTDAAASKKSQIISSKSDRLVPASGAVRTSTSSPVTAVPQKETGKKVNVAAKTQIAASPPKSNISTVRVLTPVSRSSTQNPPQSQSKPQTAAPKSLIVRPKPSCLEVIDLDDDSQQQGKTIQNNLNKGLSVSQSLGQTSQQISYVVTSGTQVPIYLSPTINQGTRVINSAMANRGVLGTQLKNGQIIQLQNKTGVLSGNQFHLVTTNAAQFKQVIRPTMTLSPGQKISALKQVPQRVVTRVHPAPLPPIPIQTSSLEWKARPPKPTLRIGKNGTGITLSWTLNGYDKEKYAEIVSYQLFAYQEGSDPPSTELWKKVGDVKALPLPMACTLTKFVSGHRYHFAVQAVDIHSRVGEYSTPDNILLN